MSTRRRRNVSHLPEHGSDLAIVPITGCAIILVVCVVKYIFEGPRRNREVPRYETEPTDSELSFEPYMPHRPRSEQRDQRPLQGHFNPNLDPSQRSGSVRTGPINVPTATQRQPRRRSRTPHAGSRVDRYPSAEPATGRPIECQICFEDKHRSAFPARNITARCTHRATACCTTCLARAITTSFNGNTLDNIRCPICNHHLQFQDMAAHAPPDIFQRYDAFYLHRALERDLPTFRWCVNPHCTYGEEHPTDSPSPIIECSVCGILACSRHNIPWHDGESCRDYDRRIGARQSRAESKSEKAIKRVAKRCPGCRRFIHKNGGCNHMTCLCGRQFCWTCLHDFPGHVRHCPRDPR